MIYLWGLGETWEAEEVGSGMLGGDVVERLRFLFQLKTKQKNKTIRKKKRKSKKDRVHELGMHGMGVKQSGG